jgi:Rrf2 family nitric oxide-sensitive transcriptional repressor
MRLTLHTDYSLRVLIHLAAGDQERSSISEIAEAYDISRNHLMKVVHELGRGGFINTIRGRGGGFTLARPANQIRIGDVVRFSETDLKLVDCTTCVIKGSCGLIGVLDEARRAFLDVLDRYTIADAAADKDRLRTALFPVAAA